MAVLLVVAMLVIPAAVTAAVAVVAGVSWHIAAKKDFGKADNASLSYPLR